MALETELKLLAAPEVLRRLPGLQMVRARRAGPGRRQHLLTRYFDTPTRALEQAGMALRVREQGGRWVQTVKTGGASVAGLASRGEWDAPLDDGLPSLDALRDTPAFKAMGGARGFRGLTALFETDFERRTIPLRFDDGSSAELCIDSGVVRAGSRTQPISEIELELTGGASARLFEFAFDLAGEVPLRIGHASKAERGHALSLRRAMTPVRGVRPPLHKDMSRDEALRTLAAACIDHLLANEAGMLAGRDPEYLHQMRVALRRMRSVFAVFRAGIDPQRLAPVAATLRDAARKLGEARDWDVFALELLRPLAAGFTHDAGMGAMARKGARIRAGHGRAAREFIASAEHVRRLLQLGQWLAAPEAVVGNGENLKRENPKAENAKGVHEHGEHDHGGHGKNKPEPLVAFAARMLQARHRRVRKLGERLQLAAPGGGTAWRGESIPWEELHQLRIRAKKLRYAAEFFESLFRGGRARPYVRPYVRSLAALQDVLGRLNDCATGTLLLGQLAAEPGKATDVAALARADGWLAASRHRQLEALPSAWKRFGRQGRFWKDELPEDAPAEASAPPAEGKVANGAT